MSTHHTSTGDSPSVPHHGTRHGAGPAVAILRGGTGEHVEAVVDTLVGAGVRAVELTTNTPRWREGTAWTARRFGDGVSVGVGTVLDPEQVDDAADLGASFVVSPHLDPAIGERAHERGLGWYPGAATPTEIVRAWRLGARAVKVFPAAQLGGPAYLRQVLAPLDFVDVVPTGGIGIDDAADYLAAGAVAVGLGSPLVGDALGTGDTVALRSRAERLVAGLAR
ncbi:MULTISPECIES: bifunctional 4-hydroxy-2-oxoglutarate aldolase/2-dehydro-3-deoxy-phosphogluconate aldolase [unclassified Curtobacterium]|uniref:bifunctional 4-hydroxy-2-oxoglutarate aldolase/2-dehydro-3-deoxy-phosphogluconate aldolase n=1 Tax=unclassified Curtobacterium TaxID=257496 RepID=UPI000A7A7E18|nr:MULTISPECIES: bifunctional 4-hydroxy-2-oxoglutarate aldolase/2-dehydro-3-deoxy-phosphogluconate aldolase [unclassified Curtobacterium]MCM3504327.1 bifunctional 4-hydroxy-2-oxoglutarate aldolase/2-dehydro-3-deoxy-phosphogluconate aldolase [Curtobacterium sp. ODYSSEY 48 V2]MCM3520296.1 bifunctional 4-hydroxy-2-oxoglutarate aldolase/2-dehydro-3-deoxy-phosphogluconate aldolase [Curtobacterium sp. P97]